MTNDNQSQQSNQQSRSNSTCSSRFGRGSRTSGQRGRVEQNPDDDGVRARFFPDGFDGEVVLTEDEVHLFAPGHEVAVPLDICEDISAVIEHVRHVTDAAEEDDEVVANLAAFTGMFRFLANVGSNSYLNPPKRARADYGVTDASEE